MRLDKRLRRLETTLLSDPIVLVFADGSTREIRYQGPGMLSLFMAALSAEQPGPQMREHLDWIRDCVGYIDPAGGHMIDIIKMALKTNPDDVFSPPACVRPPQLDSLPGSANRGVA